MPCIIVKSMHSNTIIKYFIGHKLCTAARCVICRGSSLIKLSRCFKSRKVFSFVIFDILAHFAAHQKPNKKQQQQKTKQNKTKNKNKNKNKKQKTKTKNRNQVGCVNNYIVVSTSLWPFLIFDILAHFAAHQKPNKKQQKKNKKKTKQKIKTKTKTQIKNKNKEQKSSWMCE